MTLLATSVSHRFNASGQEMHLAGTGHKETVFTLAIGVADDGYHSGRLKT